MQKTKTLVNIQQSKLHRLITNLALYLYSLEMAQKLVETENIEFTCLVERMHQINRRLEGDTANLLKVKAVEDYKIDGERLTLEQTRRRNMNARANHAVQKKECRENQEEAITTMR